MRMKKSLVVAPGDRTGHRACATALQLHRVAFDLLVLMEASPADSEVLLMAIHCEAPNQIAFRRFGVDRRAFWLFAQEFHWSADSQRNPGLPSIAFFGY